MIFWIKGEFRKEKLLKCKQMICLLCQRENYNIYKRNIWQVHCVYIFFYSRIYYTEARKIDNCLVVDSS